MSKFMYLLIILGLSGLLSCSGYKIAPRSNPLLKYNIRTLSVPMFVTDANLANFSAPFTKEFINLLSSFSGLKVHGGFKESSDAVLVGIVQTPQKISHTMTNTQQRVASTIAPTSLSQGRRDFYIPGSTQLTMSVRVMLLKNPTPEELKLLKSKFGHKLMGNKKIIFNEIISVTDSFNREIFDARDGQVNSTQNYGLVGRSVSKMAKNAAKSFQEMMLYAF